MNKFQKLQFKSIDDFLEYLPEDELKIVNRLRQLILDCIPDCVEKLSYNVPYYYRHSRICFIWPASVPWGNVKMKGVQLGFCNGNKLNDEIKYLERGNRKQVYIKTFYDVKDIETDLLRSYILEAVMRDEKLKKK
ncbi:MAG: hypothetical protein A2057_05245 [Ignavibacteria bacterium GWA2_35_9]|nr:MAG: hypothetical protein A2057_05245 [Ignavibacteria bacterium GWA2_35_9]OGU47958.1 MAG: hypothetical protein A2000_00290 [Ignavibacteria bacterium GWB2_36_8]OGU53670.1 MAG: hypothetical protein A2080_12160 [Ignavibacteria bacterium GWC2_36_12]